MTVVRCNFCGSERVHQRVIDYLYSYQGEYLLAPHTPAEICADCGMAYYDAAVLKEIERRFFAIREKAEAPDRYIVVPEAAFSPIIH